ncbi:PH domain-containing protein [Mycena sanguinolenta]|uniref:PH domain-containing protein n=1 Tax=Mycena sanguinolenta TaxID=230812 RepID=A0A8H6YY33_9AGAR|nr:PH domain-containing protein [Mycena sanguinolenta]
MNSEKIKAEDMFDHGGLDDAQAERGTYDKNLRLVESWKHDMESLLIIAVLFSVILTAFLFESYNSVNVRLLAQISHQLAISANGDTFDVLSLPSLPTPQSSVISRTLWFMSLGFSITYALVATFVQQWARDFLHKADSFVAIDRSHIFSYGPGRLQMLTVVKIVPLLLYTSLLLFFGGLAAFLIPVDLPMEIIAATLVVTIAAMYCVIQFLEYPYRTPLPVIFWRAVQYLQTSWAERGSEHKTKKSADSSDAQAQTPLEAISRTATENSDRRSQAGHDEHENGEHIFTERDTEREEGTQMNAGDQRSSPSRPSTVLGDSASNPSVRASGESASIRTASINEAERFAREREELMAERARLEVERDAARNALIAEKDAQIKALRAELDNKFDREKQLRSQEYAEVREREPQVRLNIDGGITKGQLRDFAYLIQDQRDVCERMETLMEERWNGKQERSQNKELRLAELKDMVQNIHDDMEAVRGEEGKPGIEKVIEEIVRQNAEQREFLTALSDTWRADYTRQHEETINVVRSTAREQVDFNVQGYLDEFSKTLASEMRMLLGEVGKLREERRALQHELGYLLGIKSKYGPGGEFEPEWKPAPGGPPLDPGPPPPPPDLPQAKPGWRTHKTRKKDAASPPPPVPGPDPRHQSWATWQPDPNLAPTPPAHEPTLLVPEVSSPGLFGPRSPSSRSPQPPVQSWATRQPDPKSAPSLNKDEVLSWASWQPDPNLAPTPPAHEPALLVSEVSSPGLFGPRSPNSSVHSWAIQQPDPKSSSTNPNLAPTPLAPEDVRRRVESWATAQHSAVDPPADATLESRPPPPEAPPAAAAWPSDSILLTEDSKAGGDRDTVATPPPREHMMLPIMVPEIPRSGV